MTKLIGYARVSTKQQDTDRQFYPFTLAELRAVHAALREENEQWADIALILGLTGLRWGELRALRVRDVNDLPYPSLSVSRSAPDSQEVRTQTKGGGTRVVPLAAELVPILKQWAGDREPNATLFATSTGSMINGRNWDRRVR